MLTDAKAREHMGRCADLATSYDPHLYTVESVHQADQASGSVFLLGLLLGLLVRLLLGLRGGLQ